MEMEACWSEPSPISVLSPRQSESVLSGIWPHHAASTFRPRFKTRSPAGFASEESTFIVPLALKTKESGLHCVLGAMKHTIESSFHARKEIRQ
jgi:hypothetical protein